MHIVKCYYCNQSFDRDKEEFVKVNSRRYAHKRCAEDTEASQSQEEKDKKALEEYIMKLFKTDFVNPMIQKQITQFKNDYHYTYSGILKALIYFYEVKHNSVEKANGRISIVPYIYQQAYNYYFALWQAQQRNSGKQIELYTPKVREIVISVPERKVKTRKKFSFLDEEEGEI